MNKTFKCKNLETLQVHKKSFYCASKMVLNENKTQNAQYILEKFSFQWEKSIQKFLKDDGGNNFDGEERCECSMLDSFLYTGLSSAIQRINYFFSPKFQKVFRKFADYLITNRTTGRGRESTFTSKFRFYVSLGVNARMCMGHII